MGNTQGADQLQEAIGDLQQLIAATNEKVMGLPPSSNSGSTLESVNKTLQATEATLRKAQESLNKLDAVLDDTKAITRNARAASQDLEQLRYEVEASLRTADELMRDVQRVWPLSQDPEKGLALP